MYVILDLHGVFMSYGKRITWLDSQNRSDSLNNIKKIVLFDMDGTLTEPREKFNTFLIKSLENITNKAHIGIVTGSDYDYLIEQMAPLLQSKLRTTIHLLPCNGTKYYPPPKQYENDYKLVHSLNMKEKLGESDFKKLMMILINKQANLDLNNISIPLTGHFISYRNSMINWCPIGRNATNTERKVFVEYDSSRAPSYRSIILSSLKETLALAGLMDKLVVKLGGSTSFDIYPIGWDKTYCLNHFNEWETWFVGDRCDHDGNDREIYDLLLKTNKSFKTKNTINTKLIIEENIIPYL